MAPSPDGVSPASPAKSDSVISGLVAIFLGVFAAQLWLAAHAGTDIPFYDQWDNEGRWLYPGWMDGTLHFSDLFRPHNEHRIFWTNLLNLALFTLNRQWDPLVQLFAIAVLRSLTAVLAGWILMKEAPAARRWVFAVCVIVAFLPQLAWHNVLWGFQSQVYFVLIFVLITFCKLGKETPSLNDQLAGLVSGIAGLVAMGSGALAPVALLSLFLLRWLEERHSFGVFLRRSWPAVLVMATAILLSRFGGDTGALRMSSWIEGISVCARLLAWPHVEQNWAAIVLNLPLIIVLFRRLVFRKKSQPGENLVLVLAFFAILNAAATGIMRGGGVELQAGVPSRYVDFVILLPLANLWFFISLFDEVPSTARRVARLLGAAWIIFLFVGWLGLSSEMISRILIYRVRDQDAPVRLAVLYQKSHDPRVFEGQPRLLIPHPNAESVRVVLFDPHMRDVLPPSLNETARRGPLSALARWIFSISTAFLIIISVGVSVLLFRARQQGLRAASIR